MELYSPAQAVYSGKLMVSEVLKDYVFASLGDMKARDITVIDVRGKTFITDFIVIATGTSDRHAKAVAEKLIEDMKNLDTRPLGVEGMAAPSWILVDLGDVVVHVMQLEARVFYDIEQLWYRDIAEQQGHAR